MSTPDEKTVYRTPRKAITKADKIFNSMLQVQKINASMRVSKKLDRGIVVVKELVK